jgi:hypothetical protein
MKGALNEELSEKDPYEIGRVIGPPELLYTFELTLIIIINNK